MEYLRWTIKSKHNLNDTECDEYLSKNYGNEISSTYTRNTKISKIDKMPFDLMKYIINSEGIALDNNNDYEDLGICRETTYPRIIAANHQQDNIFYLKPIELFNKQITDKIDDVAIRNHLVSHMNMVVKLLLDSFSVVEDKTVGVELIKKNGFLYFTISDQFSNDILNVINTLNAKYEGTIKYYIYSNTNSVRESISKLLTQDQIYFIPKEQVDNYNKALREMKKRINN